MTYDFFNTSNLAFGKKLTSAFNSLNELAKSAEDNLEQVFIDLEYFNQYGRKNYRISRPTKANHPCRSNEIFNLINERIIFKTLEVNDGELSVELLKFNDATHKVTFGSGITSIKSGKCYLRESISNLTPQQELLFVADEDTDTKIVGEALFSYRIDKNDKLCFRDDLSILNSTGYDFSQYKSITSGENVELPYTANDFECIVVVGKDSELEMKINGKVTAKISGENGRNYAIAYLKPDDKLEGICSEAFKVNYIGY